MAITMSRSTRDEYLEKMRCRYRRYTGKLARSRLLDEFCEVTGHERKYATKLLSGRRGPPVGAGCTPSRGGRPAIYDAEVTGVLHEIWRHSEQPCGKRLKPMLGTWLPFYERRYGVLPAKTRDGVLSISAAQIDRVLAPRKVGAGIVNRRTPKAHAAIKALVPVRAECWDAREPGWIEADTVAHCGGDMGGRFLWSLTATDIFSGWTEVRATWNRGQYGVCAAFVEIEGGLPFALLGVDTDNGGEFLNHHLHRHFRGRERHGASGATPSRRPSSKPSASASRARRCAGTRRCRKPRATDSSNTGKAAAIARRPTHCGDGGMSTIPSS